MPGCSKIWNFCSRVQLDISLSRMSAANEWISPMYYSLYKFFSRAFKVELHIRAISVSPEKKICESRAVKGVTGRGVQSGIRKFTLII